MNSSNGRPSHCFGFIGQELAAMEEWRAKHMPDSYMLYDGKQLLFFIPYLPRWLWRIFPSLRKWGVWI